jgi:hypothetical protein
VLRTVTKASHAPFDDSFFRFSSAIGPGTFPSQSFDMALQVCCIVASLDKYVFSVETRASGVIDSISVSESVRSDGPLTDTTGTGTAAGEVATAAGGADGTLRTSKA